MNLTLQTRITPLAAIAMLAFSAMPALAISQLAAQEAEQASPVTGTDSTESIEQLFGQLDSTSFNDREAATEKLIQRGPEIFEDLTDHFFECSSEAGWRIHKILEGISKNGKEEDFLKSVAIIQLLYGAKDAQSQGRLASLQFRWMVTRRTEAARKLNELGFTFNVRNGSFLHGGEIDPAHVEMMIRAVELRDIGGGIEIATSAPVEDASPRRLPVEWVNPRLDQRKAKMKVSKIINGSAEDNRKIVESSLATAFHAKLPAGTLKFPEGWNADEETLKLIRDLGTLSSLTFQQQHIDGELQKFISAEKSLTKLELINCKFDEESTKLTLPASIVNLSLTGSLPPPASFRSLSQIRALKLSNTKLDEDVSYAISKRKIQTIELEDVSFSKTGIKQLINMNGLLRMSLSLCKFELAWLEDFRKRNPRTIVANPKAFLGVQGPTPINETNVSGCQISHVVPDKAAAEAGMRPNDIVTALDGQKIRGFDDLRLLISQKRPGDPIDVEILRGNKKVELKVTLGEMDPGLR